MNEYRTLMEEVYGIRIPTLGYKIGIDDTTRLIAISNEYGLQVIEDVNDIREQSVAVMRPT